MRRERWRKGGEKIDVIVVNNITIVIIIYFDPFFKISIYNIFKYK